MHKMTRLCAALVFAAALVCKMAPAMAETEPQTGVSFPVEIVGEKGPLKYVLRPVFLDRKRSASSTGSDPAEHALQHKWAPRGLCNSPLSRDLLGATSPVCSHAASVRCDGAEAERNSRGPPAVVGRLAGTAVRVKKIAFIPIQVATPCPRMLPSPACACATSEPLYAGLQQLAGPTMDSLEVSLKLQCADLRCGSVR